MKHDAEEFLLRAAEHGDLRLLRSAVDNGANVNYADKTSGFTALHLACYYGHIDIVSHLLQLSAQGSKRAVDINALTIDNYSPLMVAVVNGKADIVALLMQHSAMQPDLLITTTGAEGEHSGFTALHLAAMSGDSHILRSVAVGRSGAFYSARTTMGYTALQLAVEMQQLSLAEELLVYEKESFVDIHGNSFHSNNRFHGLHRDPKIPGSPITGSHVPSLNIQNDVGNTPLHSAVSRGEAALVKVFLHNGAAVNIPDVAGFTALHWSAMLDLNDISLQLLQHGAQTNLLTTATSNTIDDTTAAAAEAVDELRTQYLQFYQACHDSAPTAQQQQQMSQLLQQSYGYSPLMLALAAGNIRTAELLLQHFADPLQRSGKGELTPLHMAAKSGNSAAVALLLNTGAYSSSSSAGFKDQFGMTPLMTAAMSGHVAVSQLLLQHFGAADAFQQRCNSGKKALDYALENNHRDVYEALIDSFAQLPHQQQQQQKQQHPQQKELLQQEQQKKKLTSSGTSKASTACDSSNGGSGSITVEAEGGFGSFHIDLHQLNYDLDGDCIVDTDAEDNAATATATSVTNAATATAAARDGEGLAERKSFIDTIIDSMDGEFNATYAALDASLRSSSSSSYDSSCGDNKNKKMKQQQKQLKKQLKKEQRQLHRKNKSTKNCEESSACVGLRGKKLKKCLRRLLSDGSKSKSKSGSTCSDTSYTVDGDSDVDVDISGDEDGDVVAPVSRRFMVLPEQTSNEEDAEYLFVRSNSNCGSNCADSINSGSNSADNSNNCADCSGSGGHWVPAADFDFDAADNVAADDNDVFSTTAADNNADDAIAATAADAAVAGNGFCVDAAQWKEAKKAVRKYRKQAKHWQQLAMRLKHTSSSPAAVGLGKGDHGITDSSCSNNSSSGGGGFTEFDRLYLTAVCVLLLLIALSLIVFIRIRLQH